LGIRLARLWNLSGSDLERWERIIEGSCIDRRFAVRPPEEILHLRTQERMELYALEAPPLAAAAARQALEDSGLPASSITDLVIVTCTGFRAPGVDVELVDRLGLSPSVRRVQVGYMGCFGAITGLRTAAGACCADRCGVALVVCIELCSLHAQAEASPQNQICCALFGDAAVAAVVVGPASQLVGSSDGELATGVAPIGSRQIHLGRSLLTAGGREAMTWTITDAGFAMTLSRDVPAALRQEISALATEGSIAPGHRLAIHPGGAAILDLIEAALEGRACRGIEHARSVLREVGNVSSGSVLLVAERLMAESSEPLTLMAFGPGLTVDMVGLGREGRRGNGGSGGGGGGG